VYWLRPSGPIPRTLALRAGFFGFERLDELGLSRLAVRFDGGDLAVQRTPGLDIRPVRCYRLAGQQVPADGGTGQPAGEPNRIDLGSARVEQPGELGEQPLNPRVRLCRIPRRLAALVRGNSCGGRAVGSEVLLPPRASSAFPGVDRPPCT
jgi:hypothetical protein